MIKLYTTYFDASEQSRVHELQSALLRNFNNSIIDKIVIFNENNADLSFIKNKNKLVCIDIPKRPRFIDFIQYINYNVTKEDVSIIANTDIYFNQSLKFVDKFLSSKKVLALSRFDLIGNNRIQYYKKWDSQDSWVFKGKISLKGGEYYLGKPGCDNKIAYESLASGYEVIDNSLDIISYHIHSSDIRTYNIERKTNVVEKPYLYLLPEKPIIKNNPDIKGFINYLKRIAIYRQMNYEFCKDFKFEDKVHINKKANIKFLNMIKYFDYFRIKNRSVLFKKH